MDKTWRRLKRFLIMPFENLLAKQFFKVHYYCLQRLIYYLEGIFFFLFSFFLLFCHLQEISQVP